jgi:hypothetical protein
VVRIWAAWRHFSPSIPLLLTPTTGEPPTRLGEFDAPEDNPAAPILRAVPLAGFNTTGQPAISLPLSQSEAGLPVGVQLVAATGGEDLLLRVVSQLEAAHPWAGRTPTGVRRVSPRDAVSRWGRRGEAASLRKDAVAGLKDDARDAPPEEPAPASAGDGWRAARRVVARTTHG